MTVKALYEEQKEELIDDLKAKLEGVDAERLRIVDGNLMGGANLR
jgi:hypothetical protein